MYAIIETGGKQYRVRPGDTIEVERLEADPGSTLEMERVLMVGGEDTEARVGRPTVSNAVVRAEVLDHARGEKVLVFRFKSKVRYRRRTGHRQHLTRLRITDIQLVAPPAEASGEEAAPPARRRRATPKSATTAAPAADA